MSPDIQMKSANRRGTALAGPTLIAATTLLIASTTMAHATVANLFTGEVLVVENAPSSWRADPGTGGPGSGKAVDLTSNNITTISGLLNADAGHAVEWGVYTFNNQPLRFSDTAPSYTVASFLSSTTPSITLHSAGFNPSASLRPSGATPIWMQFQTSVFLTPDNIAAFVNHDDGVSLRLEVPSTSFVILNQDSPTAFGTVPCATAAFVSGPTYTPGPCYEAFPFVSPFGGNGSTASVTLDYANAFDSYARLDAFFIPEPFTLGFLALGAGVLGVIRRR